MLLARSFTGLSFDAGPGNHPEAVSGTSSIRIPPGYSVIIYDSTRFAGKAKLLTESVRCLAQDGLLDFENQVDSFKVSASEPLRCKLACSYICTCLCLFNQASASSLTAANQARCMCLS